MEKRILIADDEREARILIQMNLDGFGFVFLEAKDGKSAIELAKSEMPDLIIMDHLMPGLSGYEAIKELQRDEGTRKIPVIMLTKAEFDKSMKETIKFDVVEFIQKPYDPDDLIKAVGKALGMDLERKEDKKPISMKKIIIADDDKDVRELLKIILEKKYKIICAKDGKSLLELTRKEVPDLIVTDVMMPGLDGFRAVDKLRKTSKTSLIPALFVSARITDKNTYESLKPEGPTDFLLKPFKEEKLLEKVKKLLGEEHK